MAKSTSANLGFEEKLWSAADKMRNNMDPSEYKHVVLGLIFLKYISDSFEELHEKLKTDKLADPEDKDEYLAENVFWVPQEARWIFLLQNAKKAEIGKLVDDAMVAIEKGNPSLKGVLPKDYARPTLDKQRLGELIDLIGTIGLGDKESKSKDVLGRVYEYFIGRFASAEGKGGGEFYTPSSVVKLLVKMIEPYKGRVYDPCCGSGGMFVQSKRFVEEHGGRTGDISIYGQESNNTTWRLCKMNLAIRGIEADIKYGNSFTNDQLPDLKADFVLANPPFNDSDWGGERLQNDVRWKFGTPSNGNANFAWIQHFIQHLSPNGIAGFVLANQALSSKAITEYSIRKNIIEDDLIDCIVSLPDKLFYTTPIPASLWFMSRNKNNGKSRNRKNEILFIDAENLFKTTSRTANELPEESLERIVNKYREWKSIKGNYKDEPGFCKSVPLAQVIEGDYSLFPAQYVGFEHKIEKYSKDQVNSIGQELWNSYKSNLIELSEVDKKLSNLLTQNNSVNLPIPKNFEEVSIGEILTPIEERLGEKQEPEVLTLTETAGLMLQKERFAKRVAIKNTRKYKIIRKTNIVYNPYLLWAGAIDQCWVVDVGIISPAYENFGIKEGYNPTLIGKILKSKLLLKMYNGISVGTVKRRRRAPVEKFLNLKITIPSKEEQLRFSEYTEILQKELANLKAAKESLSNFINEFSNIWINGTD